MANRPTSMKAWQYTTTTGGLENTLFTPASGAPRPTLSPSGLQLLIRVHSAALNPADYKVPEIGLIARPLIPSPATPGMDFCGTVVETGDKVDSFRIGDVVFGTRVGSLGQGSLGEYIVVEREMCAEVPKGLEDKMDEMASVGVAGLTAYQSIVPNVTEGKGEKVFVNGGSGGTGIFGIQIAKALGCVVVASCSTANIELCKGLGADEVLDYTNTDVVAALAAQGPVFKLVVDNVGTPSNLYKASHQFLTPDGKFCQIGAGFSVQQIAQMSSNMLLPGFLGGGKNKYEMVMMSKPKTAELARIGRWMVEGKVKAVIDEVFEFEQAPKAFTKLRTGRAKGKIVVRVSSK